MKHEVTDRLFFGDESSCTHECAGSVAVVHACKEPCHRRAVGYSERSLPSSHSNYLVLERGHHLYLNLIDPPAPLFMMPSFVAFMRFVDAQISARPVLIHCNEGRSRAPSLALLYASKRLSLFPADSYAVAAAGFRQRFPYEPGLGIQKWLTNNWSGIL
jgi:predicted protein tyrosine phosphatase